LDVGAISERASRDELFRLNVRRSYRQPRPLAFYCASIHLSDPTTLTATFEK